MEYDKLELSIFSTFSGITEFAFIFQAIQWVKFFIGWLKSSKIITKLFALSDKFLILNSGDIFFP